MIGLGIETSCDETSVGIVRDGKELLSLKVYSQIPLHSPHGGIVPEIASRSHLEKLNPLLEESIREAKISFHELDYVAVTNRPGLLGSLLVGVQGARALGISLGIPVYPVDHLEAHFSVLSLEDKLPPYPFLGLLLSGGNTAIFLVKNPEEMDILSNTKDDAIGEAFDKVSVLLGLGYPGGPAIEREANKYTRKKGDIPLFPKLLKDSQDRQFSYSGIKTSVLQLLKKMGSQKPDLAKVCFDFQNSVFELVERNLQAIVSDSAIRTVVAAGGVLANTTLRTRLDALGRRKNFKIFYPEKKIFCTDNGAMVACQGYILAKSGKQFSPNFKVTPSREHYHET